MLTVGWLKIRSYLSAPRARQENFIARVKEDKEENHVPHFKPKSLATLLVALFSSGLLMPAVSQEDFETELLWVAKVTIANRIEVGESKHGLRRIVPITGGNFAGPGIKGRVLPVGADWQLVRPDGTTELHARYLMQTEDGYVIQIINQVLSRSDNNGGSYRRSVIDLEAPINSPYEHLNDYVFLGTLDVPTRLEEGESPYVIISVYRLL